MQTIFIKSNSSKIVFPLLTNALEREKAILSETITKEKENIRNLAEKLTVDIDKLIEGEIEHTESNEMELIELEGEIEILRHLENELNALESLEICT